MSRIFEKIVSWTDVDTICTRLRAEKKKIVFTNGCFDIIHAGHVNYLEKARASGDFLIVGLNSDSSVKKNKGEKRPIMSESERATVLSSLVPVDLVIIFAEPTPLDLISRIKPDVLIKGGDWAVEQTVGRELVEKNGGKVFSIPFEENISTSTIIQRIIDRYTDQVMS